jgi:hypothetical protein
MSRILCNKHLLLDLKEVISTSAPSAHRRQAYKMLENILEDAKVPTVVKVTSEEPKAKTVNSEYEEVPYPQRPIWTLNSYFNPDQKKLKVVRGSYVSESNIMVWVEFDGRFGVMPNVSKDDKSGDISSWIVWQYGHEENGLVCRSLAQLMSFLRWI